MKAKKIRLFYICALCTALLCVLTPAALAAGTAVDLPALKMKTEVPSGWTVLTRELPETDPAWQQIGLKKDDWMHHANQTNAYLSALSDDGQSELIITMEQDKDIRKAYDLNLLDDDALAEFENEQVTQRERAGKTVTRLRQYAHCQALFYAIIETDASVHTREYVTIVNGMGITIAMKSLSGEITGDVGAALLYVMDNLVFTEITERPGFDYSTILYGMIGIFLFIGFALVIRIRSRKKQSAAARKDDDPGKFKNKYTRW